MTKKRRFPIKIHDYAQNHEHALAICMHYNFGRIHKTLRVTPAMEAGVAKHVWTLEEIAKLAE